MRKASFTLVVLFFFIYAKAQHNVILIIADDLGTDWCGFYEDHVDTVGMPHIRTLLDKGVRFKNVTANPVCSPTRAGIFTGRYSFRTGVGTIVLDPADSAQLDTAEITIPRMLNVYDSTILNAHIGKWHLHYNLSSQYIYPNIMGYNHYEGNFAGVLPSYYNWTKITDGIASNDTVYATIEAADNAISWIKTTGSNPFFLWLAFNAPHVPYDLPPPGLYSDTTLSGTETDINANPKKYFKASVEALDHEIGRLFDSLQVLNKLDSTDIIFIGDNGNAKQVVQNGNPNKAKSTIYEYGVHVPMIIAGPSVVNPGRVSDALINTVDLYATILELFNDTSWQTNIPISKPVDSKSILPILKDIGTQIRPWAFTETFNYLQDSSDRKGIRNFDYKLHHYKYKRQEFYNLNNDPSELNDLLKGTFTATDSINYYFLCNELNTLTGTGGYCDPDFHLLSVSISVNATTICSGKYANFTATVINGGNSPFYQWKKNGIKTGSNSRFFSKNTLVNGDVITCEVTTSGVKAKSNAITMTVLPNVTPAISITPSSTAICKGTNVTFNAMATDTGATPIYRWKKNGTLVGTNFHSYNSSSLVNSDVIKCILTSNATCAATTTATSNQVVMSVKSIPAKPGNIAGINFNLCNTTSDFTYSVSNVTNATSYTWTVPANAILVSGQGTASIVVNYTSLFKSGIIAVSASNDCGSSAARQLNVFSKTETPGAITGLQEVCAEQQNVSYSVLPVPGATGYKWTVPAGCTITNGQNTNAIITGFGLTAGNISVYAKNGCVNSATSSLPVIINCKAEQENVKLNEPCLITFNPFYDEIIFTVNSSLGNTTISLTDATGRKLYQWINVSLKPDKSHHLTIDKGINPGIYFLTIKNSTVFLTSKMYHP